MGKFSTDNVELLHIKIEVLNFPQMANEKTGVHCNSIPVHAAVQQRTEGGLI